LDTAEDFTHLREIVVQSKLWLSSPTAFNDPFDMRAKFVFDASPEEKRARLRKFLQDEGKKHHEIERLLPGLMVKANAERLIPNLQKTTAEIGVCSFAGDPRSILMWSHYASNHEGLCLVFEISRDPVIFLEAMAVEYSSDYPVVNWVKDFDGGGPLSIVLRKHEGWKYEKERRIIKFHNANTHLKFGPLALRAVITGCRIRAETRAKLSTLISERTGDGLPSLDFYRCLQHESRYRLVISRVKDD
jgi:hypothetical protein